MTADPSEITAPRRSQQKHQASYMIKLGYVTLSQSPRPRLPQQNQDDHYRLPRPKLQLPTLTQPSPQPNTRIHDLTLSNPLETAESPERALE